MTPEQRAELIIRDKRAVWHPYTQMKTYRSTTEPLVIEHAQGARLFEADGRSIIDGNASWWTCLLGHNHPRLVRALKDQAERLCHTSLAGVTHQPAVEFAEALLRVSPPGLTHAFFSDNGSTAVEAAVKIAIQYWVQQPKPHKDKTHFLSLESAFHGETMGATALGDVSAFRSPFAGLTMPVTHLPSPADDLTRALEALEATLRSDAQRTAALVIEPLIQGAGGMKIYSPEYLKEARRLTEHYGVLFIVDEVFTGYGRTGKFWALDHAGVSADIVCSAKGLSGGMMPFAATLVSDPVFDAFLGERDKAFYYGHTYCGNPLGAAVACEVLKVYEDERVIEGVSVREQMIEDSIRRLSALPSVKQARSLGMCAALNLGSSGDYLSTRGWEVYQRALELGAYLRPLGHVVYLTPALNIPLADLASLLSILERSVGEILADEP